MRVVNDPDFNDPAQWSFAGTGVVDSGKMSMWGPFDICSAIDETVSNGGQWYAYNFTIDAITNVSRVFVQYGATTFWDSDVEGLTTGKKSGSFIAATSGSGLFIFTWATGGPVVFDQIQLYPMHARQIIREAVAALVTGLATTGANVFQSRAYNVNESELPCLLVYTANEEVEGPRSIGSPRQIVRTLELIVEGKAQVTADLDDTLDDIAEEVEVVIGADPTLGVNVVDCILTTVSYDYSSAGEKPIGSVLMRYAVTYITAENAPGTLL